MKTKQAKEIIGTCMEWNLYLLGVTEKPTSTLDPEISLMDLIRANNKVKAWNIEQRKKKPPYSQHQILADRLIAAIYTALNFDADGEAKAAINGKAVGVVNLKEE